MNTVISVGVINCISIDDIKWWC